LDTSQYLEIFIDESTEHLDTLYQQMLELENNPEEKSIIEEIFRAAHTLKGMSATMGFGDLANLTHKLENVFDAIRYDKIKVKTEMMDDLFVAVDHLNEMVRDIADGGDGKKDVSHIVNRLQKIEKGLPLDDVNTEQSTKEIQKTDGSLPIELDEFQITIIEQAIEQDFNTYEIYVELSEDSLLKAARVYMVFEILEKQGEVIYSNPSVSDLEEENFDYSFKIIYLTKDASEEISAKILKVSEIRKVEMNEFSIEEYKKEQEAELVKVESVKETTKDEPVKDAKKQTSASSIKAAQTKTIRVNIGASDSFHRLRL
jgi:two-component system chemotaxis sensor kinase CheA